MLIREADERHSNQERQHESRISTTEQKYQEQLKTLQSQLEKDRWDKCGMFFCSNLIIKFACPTIVIPPKLPVVIQGTWSHHLLPSTGPIGGLASLVISCVYIGLSVVVHNYNNASHKILLLAWGFWLKIHLFWCHYYCLLLFFSLYNQPSYGYRWLHAIL